MYIPKTEPYPFQKRLFDDYSSKAVWAYFNEQGTGKAKAGIDDASQAYENKVIDALLIVAPDAVKTNWERIEIPKHMPDRIPRQVFVYYSKQAKNKQHQAACKQAIAYREGLSIVCMSFSAFTTDAGKKFAKEFLSKRKAGFFLDESQNIRTPGAVRTKTIVAAGAYSEFKRCFSGTPMGKTGPLGMYSQIKFLDAMFWKRRGINDFALYKSFFADWVQTHGGWTKCLGYKNEHILQEWIKEISCRVLKADVLPDLPPKLHTRLYFDLPEEHRRVYNQMRDELRCDLLSGAEIEIDSALVSLRKLMQICCGYVKDTETDKLHPINDELPRIDAAVEWCEEHETQSIIWCRQRHDVDLLAERLGSKMARYDGKLSEHDRSLQLEAWRRGDKQHFVSNAKVGGAGLTLNEADRVLFHAVDVDLIELQQAQDRCHRPGQHHPVNYTYFIARDTCEEKIVNGLLDAKDVIQRILGGTISELL